MSGCQSIPINWLYELSERTTPPTTVLHTVRNSATFEALKYSIGQCPSFPFACFAFFAFWLPRWEFPHSKSDKRLRCHCNQCFIRNALLLPNTSAFWTKAQRRQSASLVPQSWFCLLQFQSLLKLNIIVLSLMGGISSSMG
jgi:hypothetical protein